MTEKKDKQIKQLKPKKREFFKHPTKYIQAKKDYKLVKKANKDWQGYVEEKREEEAVNPIYQSI